MLKIKMTKSQFVPNLKKMDEITVSIFLTKGAFTYDVRWFWGIFDLPTYLP